MSGKQRRVTSKHLNISNWIAVNILICFCTPPVNAQITVGKSLPNNSSISMEGKTTTITGGTQAGDNLFHSFEQFSVPTENTAYFNNALDIQNIFSRVTGSSISNIDGLIRANGTANLFLLNPNGIIFGPNAKLDLGGSFLGSSASSIDFADGVRFSATSPEDTPLLTVDVPVGLGFGSNPGRILVQGTGHSLVGIVSVPVTGGNTPNTGLRVKPNKSLVLVGGDIVLEAGILSAEGGRLELGAIDDGTVALNTDSTGINLEYSDVPSFRNILLSKRSLIDGSGKGISSIELQARDITLKNGSVILQQN